MTPAREREIGPHRLLRRAALRAANKEAQHKMVLAALQVPALDSPVYRNRAKALGCSEAEGEYEAFRVAQAMAYAADRARIEADRRKRA
jgi:hypothetical protein